MIVFILCLLLGASLLAYVILSSIKKKHFSKTWTPVVGILATILLIAPTFSVTYHIVNDGKAYQEILVLRQGLKTRLENAENEELKTVAIQDIERYNRQTQRNIDCARSQWVSAFVYPFYYQKGEALIITVK